MPAAVDWWQPWPRLCLSPAYSRRLYGGRSWNNLPGPATSGWRALGGNNLGRIFLVGNVGEFGVLSAGKLQRAYIPNAAPRPLRAVEQIGQNIVAVGGGAIWRLSAAKQWENVQGAPSSQPISGAFDFAAVASSGENLWCAGSPGTVIFHSVDGGNTWNPQSTGQRLPLRDLTFVDDDNGWAVGEQGVILHTSDGGTTWGIQRQPATRASVLAIYPDAERIDFETLAYLSAQHGYRTKVIVVGSNKSRRAAWSQSWYQAVIETGASTPEQYWEFPLPSRRDEVSTNKLELMWQRARTAPQSQPSVAPSTQPVLTERISRSIRMWQPSVILTAASGTGTQNAIEQVIEKATVDAQTRLCES